MTEHMTDISDLAPVVDSHEPEYLDLEGVGIYGTRAERRALFAALAKAQAAFGAIKKTEVNPHFGKKYAPLDNVLEATMPALNANGLALLNAVSDAEKGKDLHTMLTHSSGAVMHMTMLMPSVTKPQELGAQITYARRYSVQCVTGTAPEPDDDGNLGSATPQPKQEASKTDQRKEQSAPKSEPPPPPKGEPLTEEQGAAIGAAFVALKWAKPEVIRWCKSLVGTSDSRSMTKEQGDILLAALRKDFPRAFEVTP